MKFVDTLKSVSLLIAKLQKNNHSMTLPATSLSAEEILCAGRRHNVQMGNTKTVATIELPWHRHAARYRAMGMPVGTIAEMCEISKATIEKLDRTPWFQERVSEYMKSEGSDLLSIIKASALEAHSVLTEIMTNPKAPAASRVASAREILDRTLGKSIQYVDVTSTKSVDDPVAAVKAKEEELQRLRDAANGASSFQIVQAGG